jgi:RNA polymerase sigma factor (sigma-70 family)
MRSPPEEDDARPLRDARFHELLTRYGRLLQRTIAKNCPPGMSASLDDIEQDARIRLWKALQHEKDITHPVAYIYRVAVTATLRAIRRTRARREESISVEESGQDSVSTDIFCTIPATSPEAAAERQEWMRKIMLCMACLAENRRVAVGLHLQGMTTQQIGDVLGWTEPKARNLVHRGLKDLRRHLRAEGIEYRP